MIPHLVDAGVVASFARPGGNITGITDLADEVAVKHLEFLHELIPRLSRVALLERATKPRVPVAHYWPGTAEMGALLTHGPTSAGTSSVPPTT